jgi:hypothetical protein
LLLLLLAGCCFVVIVVVVVVVGCCCFAVVVGTSLMSCCCYSVLLFAAVRLLSLALPVACSPSALLLLFMFELLQFALLCCICFSDFLVRGGASATRDFARQAACDSVENPDQIHA